MAISEAFTGMVRSAVNGQNPMMRQQYTLDFFASLVVLVIYIILILFLGKFLFNEVFCTLFPMAKKATSIWQILGLAVLLALLGL